MSDLPLVPQAGTGEAARRRDRSRVHQVPACRADPVQHRAGNQAVTEATTLATPGVTVFQGDARSGLEHNDGMSDSAKPGGAARPARLRASGWRSAGLRDSTGAYTGRTTRALTRRVRRPHSRPRRELAVVLLPRWQIIGSQFWKLQVGYLARHGRVLTFDGRGTGRSSGRSAPPPTPTPNAQQTSSPCWTPRRPDRAVLVALSCAAPGRCTPPPNTPIGWPALSRSHPPAASRSPTPERDIRLRRAGPEPRAGRCTTNTSGCRRFSAFRQFFFEQMCSEPHSTSSSRTFWAGRRTPTR